MSASCMQSAECVTAKHLRPIGANAQVDLLGTWILLERLGDPQNGVRRCLVHTNGAQTVKQRAQLVQQMPQNATWPIAMGTTMTNFRCGL